MAPRKQPTVRMAWLGQELIRAREELGLTMSAAAERIDRSTGTLSTWENGHSAPKARDMPYILDRLEIADPAKREALITLARDAAKKGWWHAHVGHISEIHLDYISLEDAARRIYVHAPLLVPGLFQTEAYIREIIAAHRIWSTQEAIDRGVEIRLARQSILRRTDRDPVRVWAVVDEGALRRTVGGPAVMREQIRHILELATELPHVTVQVLPYDAGAHAGMEGPFSLLDIEGLPLIASVTSLTATLYPEPETVDVYATAHEHIRTKALPSLESLRFLGEMLEAKKGGS